MYFYLYYDSLVTIIPQLLSTYIRWYQDFLRLNYKDGTKTSADFPTTNIIGKKTSSNVPTSNSNDIKTSSDGIETSSEGIKTSSDRPTINSDGRY